VNIWRSAAMCQLIPTNSRNDVLDKRDVRWLLW